MLSGVAWATSGFHARPRGLFAGRSLVAAASRFFPRIAAFFSVLSAEREAITTANQESGRRDSNPQPSAWKADARSENASRIFFRVSPRSGERSPHRSRAGPRSRRATRRRERGSRISGAPQTRGRAPKRRPNEPRSGSPASRRRRASQRAGRVVSVLRPCPESTALGLATRASSRDPRRRARRDRRDPRSPGVEPCIRTRSRRIARGRRSSRRSRPPTEAGET